LNESARDVLLGHPEYDPKVRSPSGRTIRKASDLAGNIINGALNGKPSNVIKLQKK
jgi:hypothetical protein